MFLKIPPSEIIFEQMQTHANKSGSPCHIQIDTCTVFENNAIHYGGFGGGGPRDGQKSSKIFEGVHGK